MRWRVPRPRFRIATLLGLVAVIALGLGVRRAYWSPHWVWRRAVHGEDEAAAGSAWQQAQKGLIEGMTPEETEAELVRALDDSHFMVRFRAVQAVQFSDRAAERSIPLLIPLLGDADFRVRRSAVSAIEDKVVKDVGAYRGSAEPSLRTALDDPSAEVRRQAVNSLGTIASRAKRPDDPLIGAIAAKLKDPDEHVRIQAAFDLARLGGGDEALPMLKAYVAEHRREDGDQETAASIERALFALSRIAERSDDAVDFLLSRVYHPGKSRESPAFFSLQSTALWGQSGRDRVVSRLIEALKDSDPDRRVGAALVLESIGKAREAVSIWLEALRRQDDHDLQLHALFALRNLRPPDPKTLPALREAASHPDPQVRKYAADFVKELERTGAR